MAVFSYCKYMLALAVAAMILLTPKMSAQTASPAPKVGEIASLESIPSAPEFSELPGSSLSGEAIIVAPSAVTAAPRRPERHAFWDRKNSILFVGVGAAAAGDFFVTRANLAAGGRELNPVTRVFAGSTPALATNFVVEASSVIAVSYFLHKTGHHRLERVASMVSIGVSSSAAAYGFAHR